ETFDSTEESEGQNDRCQTTAVNETTSQFNTNFRGIKWKTNPSRKLFETFFCASKDSPSSASFPEVRWKKLPAHGKWGAEFNPTGILGERRDTEHFNAN